MNALERLNDTALNAVTGLRKIQADGSRLVDEKDTCVQFCVWEQLFIYAAHLKATFNHPNANHAIAIKTNPHPKVLKTLVDWGFGLEAASYEELLLAQNAGIESHKLVFDSPVKTQREIKLVNKKFPGITLNVNCLKELERLPSAAECNMCIGIRLNPVVDSGAEAIYNVSNDESKFGVPISHIDAILEAILQYNVTQLHIHAGSSMKDPLAAVEAIKSMVHVAERANTLLAQQTPCTERRITALDIGGGLTPEILSSVAMSYTQSTLATTSTGGESGESLAVGEATSTMHKYTNDLRTHVPTLFTEYALITEFGNWVHRFSHFCLSDVEYDLTRANKKVLFVHAGADLFMRDIYVKPRGYEFILLDNQYKEMARNGDTKMPLSDKGSSFNCDIAGPLCFAGDYLLKDQSFDVKSTMTETDPAHLCILATGSNTYGQWSRHCTRDIPKYIGIGDLHNSFESMLSLTGMSTTSVFTSTGTAAAVEMKVISQRWNPFVVYSMCSFDEGKK